MEVGGHSILLIDDENIVREAIAAYLEDSGYRVFEASDGEQGLELFRREKPDLVLCDLKMPNVDGLGVLQTLKGDPAETPIIVISGVGVMSDVVQALRYGASDYVIKPIVDMEVLEHAIIRCLEQGKLRSQNRAYRLELEQANSQLQSTVQVLEQDQLAGRHVQLKMLPPTPKEFSDYQFSHKIMPATLLSGDCVDYFTVGENYVVFFIADVSGHGASSAFVTVLLKNLFARQRSNYLHRQDDTVLSPVKLLKRANNQLLDTGTGKHATLCVGVLNLRDHSLCYSVAGHLPLPVLASADSCEYLPGEGMPVGLFDAADYTEKTLILPDSFVLTFFTDGILEVLASDGVLAQESKLLESLDSRPSSTAEVIKTLALDKVVDAPDDIAILMVSKGTL